VRRSSLSWRTEKALLAVWGLIGVWVLADLGEDVRGDSYLLRAIPWDFAVGAGLTLLIVAVDLAARAIRNLANPS